MTNRAEKMLQEVMTKQESLLADPHLCMGKAVKLVQRNIKLREAEVALTNKYGYTAAYGEEGYVDYNAREESFRVLDQTIQDGWEALSEEMDEGIWHLALMFAGLTYTERREIAEKIKQRNPLTT